MMNSSLEDLFDQILHSEQKAQERKQAIHDERLEVVKCLEQIGEKEKECCLLRSEVANWRVRLSEVELDAKLLSPRISIAEHMKVKLEASLQQHREQLQAEEAGRRTDALRFCDEMGRFSARYGGGDDALRGQQVALQARREAAAERRGSLETEIARLRKQQIDANAVTEGKRQLQGRLLALQESLRKKQQIVAAQRDVTKQLEEEKESIAELPYTDTNFKRLRDELAAYRSNFAEATCGDLERQLQQLEQEGWQRELQRKREQQAEDRAGYRQWQQQTTLSTSAESSQAPPPVSKPPVVRTDTRTSVVFTSDDSTN